MLVSSQSFRILVACLLLTVAACGSTEDVLEPAVLVEESASGIEGVWMLSRLTPSDGSGAIDPAHTGLFIFTEDYYSGVHNPTPEGRPSSAITFEPTPEEKVAQFDSIIVNTGTYEISGSTITFRPQIAKSPEFVGGYSTMSFDIDGDELTLTIDSLVAEDGVAPGDAAGTVMTFRRVE